MTRSYPHLGFDPTPGTVATVNALRTRLASSAEKLDQAYRLVERLRAGTSWEGDAAVAFREELDGALPDNLRKAHTSLLKAATALSGWETDLGGYQDRARTLDEEAGTAQQKLEAAKARERSAQADPDLKLAGQTFATDAELQNAQSRLDRAAQNLSAATTAVNDAQGNLDSVLKRARDLAEEHSTTARANARTMSDATDKLAPEEPGWFSKAMDRLGDNLTDVLGTIAAVAGLLALLLTGPIGVALLLVAAAASAATLISRLSDPKVRASLKDGFTKGEFDADFWNNAVGVVGDTLGVVPGVGAVARGINGAVRSASAATEALTLTERLASAGSKTWLAAERIAGAENPLTTLLVKGAANPERAGRVLDVAVASAGTATAAYGTAKNIFDEIKKSPVENTATFMDAVRAGTIDGAAHGSTALKTLKVLLNAH